MRPARPRGDRGGGVGGGEAARRGPAPGRDLPGRFVRSRSGLVAAGVGCSLDCGPTWESGGGVSRAPGARLTSFSVLTVLPAAETTSRQVAARPLRQRLRGWRRRGDGREAAGVKPGLRGVRRGYPGRRPEPVAMRVPHRRAVQNPLPVGARPPRDQPLSPSDLTLEKVAFLLSQAA